MSRLILIATPLALAALSLPAVAQDNMMMHDMSSLTCGELMAMDMDGMMGVSNEASMMVQMDAMSEEDMMAMQEGMSADMEGMSDEEKHSAMMMAMMEDHQAMMDAMSEDEQTAAMATAENSMHALEAACAGNDDMLVKEAAMGEM